MENKSEYNRIMNTRSYDLTTKELLEKQKYSRKNVWFFATLFLISWVTATLIFIISISLGILLMFLSIIFLIFTAISKYFEISLNTIIEIRKLKGGFKK